MHGRAATWTGSRRSQGLGPYGTTPDPVHRSVAVRVLERLRSEFAIRADFVTSVLSLYAAPVVVLALTSERSSRADGERESSVRTFFLRIDGDSVVEIWSTPSMDSTLTGRPHHVPPKNEAAGHQRRRRVVRQLAV